MPTIRKRATNWEAQVRKRGWPTVTRSFPTKADAVQWATERENEMRRGTFVDTSNLRETTLKDLLEKFRDEVTPTRRGREPETYRLNAMCALPMSALTLDRVTTQVVIEWREQRKTKVSGDTVRREMNLLSRVFTHARTEWGFHVQHPVEKLERPSAARRGRGDQSELSCANSSDNSRFDVTQTERRWPIAILGFALLPRSRYAPRCAAEKSLRCDGTT